MKVKLLSLKLPTIFGLVLLIAIVISVIFLSGQKDFFLSLKQKPGSTPNQVRIVNVSDQEFTVIWSTAEKNSGFVKWGTTTKLENKAEDDRDRRTGETGQYKNHFVTLKNLEPEKKYYFKIGSGLGLSTGLYGDRSAGREKPYEITTGSALGSPGEAAIVSGKVVNENSSAAYWTTVILTSTNIAPLATLTDKQGGWVIFLNKSRSPALNSWSIFDLETTLLNIEVIGEEAVTSLVTNIKNASPLPQDVALGAKPYDFRPEVLIPTKLALLPEQSTEEQQPVKKPLESFPLDPLPEIYLAETTTVIIDNPSYSNEKLNTTKPEIKGKGPPDTVLSLKIEPATITTSITVTKAGTWSFSPTLNPGNYTLTISYVNNNNQQQSISRTFIILSPGDSTLPAFTATQSGTLSPSPSPSLRASPSPVITTSPSPGGRVSTPSTGSGVPATGTVIPTFVVFLSGLLLFAIGTISLAILTLDKEKQIPS